MKRTCAVWIVAIVLPVVANATGLADGLKCERVRDPLRVNAHADLVAALDPELSALGCKISAPKLFCSPAAVVLHPPAGAVSGQALTNDYVCYQARCPGEPTSRTVTDTFGTRKEKAVRTSMVCVPASSGCVPTTCAAQGANCGTIADGCGGTLACGSCIAPDTCGGGGQPNVCGSSGPPGTCEAAPPVTSALSSSCRTAFPPAAGIACDVPESGPTYYVGAATGNDANDGTSPTQAWATLCHAMDATPSGSTIRVAAGTYTTAALDVNRPLVLKGGFDASFSRWDPDANPTVFTGALTLRHDAAVFGGFRMISRPVGAPGASPFADWHHVEAGTLVRNYVEIVYQASADQHYFYAILASAPAGSTSRLQCNDVYVRGIQGAGGFLLVDGIEYGNESLHLGTGVLRDNRVCVDGPSSGWVNTVVDGYGTCGASPARIEMVNNVFENAVGDGIADAMEFYGCQSDLDLVLTNNTIVSAGDGLTGYENPPGVVRWTLTNNIVMGTGGRGVGVDVGSGAVQIPQSRGNLVFGFGDNAIRPTPLATSGDATSGAWTPSQVFVSPSSGDFHPLAGGPAIDTGINVYGLATYGNVVEDLGLRTRPVTGPWERGAFER